MGKIGYLAGEKVNEMGKIGYLVGEKVMRKSMKQRKMVDSDRGMDFAPYVSGFCHIHGKTPRGILPVNSNLLFP